MNRYTPVGIFVGMTFVFGVSLFVVSTTNSNAGLAAAATAQTQEPSVFSNGIEIAGSGQIKNFLFIPKPGATVYPVAVLTPTDSNQPMALDINPGRNATGQGH